MRSLFLVSLLASCLALSGVVCVRGAGAAAGSNDAPAPWQDWFSMDCNGGAHLFPTHPVLRMHVNASIVTNAFTFASNTLASRAACHCGEDGAALRSHWLGDFGAALAAIESKQDLGKEARDKCDIKWSVSQLGDYTENFDLPATCSSADYNAGIPCRVQMPMPTWHLTLQASFTKCPGSALGSLPAIHFGCSGSACKDLLVPCSADSDCASGVSTCDELDSNSAETIADHLERAMHTVGFLPRKEQRECGGPDGQRFGERLFGQLMKLLARRTGSEGPSAAKTLKFCGVYRYGSVPLLRLEKFWVQAGWDIIPSFLRNAWQVAKHFFQPLAKKVAGHWGFHNDQVELEDLEAWDGVLDDGSNVGAPERVSGAVYGPISSTLPTPSMAASSATRPVQLLASSCNLTVTALQNETFGVTAILPGLQELLQGAMEIVEDLQQCRPPGVALSQPQFATRFGLMSGEFWLNLFSSPKAPLNGFTPEPSEDELSSASTKIWGEGPITRLLLPSTCSWRQYQANGLCSFEWSKLNGLFTAGPQWKDLAVRAAIQRCHDFPHALPSLSVQCVGADCSGFMDSARQLRACVQDSDCGAHKRCQIVSTDRIQDFFSKLFFRHRSSSVPGKEQCDSGLVNAQELFNFARHMLSRPPHNFEDGLPHFGLCTLDAQDAFPSPTAAREWAHSVVRRSGSVLLLDKMSAYAAPAVNNSLHPAEPDVDPKPEPEPEPEDGDDARGFPAIFALTFGLDPELLPSDFRARISGEVASALVVPLERFSVTRVSSVHPGPTRSGLRAPGDKVRVEFRVEPAKQGSTGGQRSPARAVQVLKEQLIDPSSPLYVGQLSQKVEAASLKVIADGTKDLNAAHSLGSSAVTVFLLAAAGLLLSRKAL